MRAFVLYPGIYAYMCGEVKLCLIFAYVDKSYFYEQPMMPPYGTPPYAAMYPHGGMYAHPSMAHVREVIIIWVAFKPLKDQVNNKYIYPSILIVFIKAGSSSIWPICHACRKPK